MLSWNFILDCELGEFELLFSCMTKQFDSGKVIESHGLKDVVPLFSSEASSPPRYVP